MQFSLKRRLRAGNSLLGTLITIPSTEVVEIMSLSGFDWLFLDMEHGAFDIVSCQKMIQAVGGRSSCLVRVSELNESKIKQVLDIGAEGVIIPRVNTAEEAECLVAYCKYPPKGQRGVGAARAQGYGLSFEEYVENANDQLLVVVQIEHIEGVKNIEEITAVEGIDVIYIGPYDLSASMGYMGQLNHPEVLEAIEVVENVCKEKSIALGYFGPNPDAVLFFKNKGYQLLTCGTDTGFLANGAKAVIDAFK